MALQHLVGSAIAGAVACLGLGPEAVAMIIERVERHAVMKDVRHLGDSLVHAALIRNDAAFEALDSVTCADDPCTRFAEPELDGLTVSGRTDEWIYERTGDTSFVLTGRSGTVTVTYESERGGIATIDDTAPTPDAVPAQGEKPAEDLAESAAPGADDSTSPADDFSHCPWPTACERLDAATTWLGDVYVTLTN